MKERGRLAFLRALALGGLLAIAAGAFPIGAAVATPQDEDADELDALLDEGVQLFRQGKEADALEKFREILAKEPTAEQAYRLRDRIESRTWILLLAGEGDTANAAKRILELASAGARALREDRSAIGRAIEDLRSEDYGERRRAVNYLVNQAGAYAVPALLGAIQGSPDTDYRSALAYTLTQIGRDAVLPLIQALKSSDSTVVKTSIGILSNLADPRAAGALQAIAESSDDASIAQRARDAAARIPGAAGQSASALWLDLARRYYHDVEHSLAESGATAPVWSFGPNGVTKAEVPREIYHLRLAEDACHEALAADPTSLDARGWLVRALVSQDHAAAMSGGSVANNANLARAAGADAIHRAIETAVAEGDVPAAVGAIEALSAIERAATTEECPVLATALGHPNRFVRYAASLAIVRISPWWGFSNPSSVVQNLVDAVGESAVRHVLVVEPDEDVRRNLVGLLSEQGFFVTAEKGGLFGLLRAKRGPAPDLVLLRNEIKDSTPDRVIRELRDDYRTKDVPVLLTSDAKDMEKVKERWADRVKGVMAWPLPVSGTEVAEAVRAALGEETNTARKLADATAVLAAQALETLAGAPVPRSEWAFDFRDEDVARLTRMLGKKDEIRTPVIVALGHAAGPNDLATSDELRRILADSANAASVRSAAARSLGKMWSTAAETPAEVVDDLASALSDSDPAVARAAAEGLGAAALSPETRARIYAMHRTSADTLSGRKAEEGADEMGDDSDMEDLSGDF